MPDKTLRVLAISAESATEVRLSGLVALGGKKSSGIVVSGLKYEGDYVVLAPAAESISLHPLRGGKNRAESLRDGSVYHLEDLSIYVEEWSVESRGADDHSAEKLCGILSDLASNRSAEKSLAEILSVLTDLCEHDHGLIASASESGRYEILASKNLESSQAWLSETLVREAISRKRPVILQNVLGSEFDANRSLMATKFLSVFCWPLVVQGVTRGVLLTASRRPYGGRIESVRERAETFANLAALILDFRLRETQMQAALVVTGQKADDRPFLTEDESVIEVCELARKLAPSALSVLIQGETGVGKEVLSRWIHKQSDRKEGPFVAVNCAAIPADLLESALFGHKRGAFTGAVADQIGKIRQADGGTLFLDEIGDLAPALQAKLLRVLQDGIVEPVGSPRPVAVDVRLVCASHKNIREMAQGPLFREDLYYRIAQVTLTLPPLRARPGDIRLLATEFLHERNPDQRIAREAWEWLLGQKWRGNVRELKSAIHRASVLAGGRELVLGDFLAGTDRLSAPLLGSSDDLEAAKRIFVFEKITQALAMTEGNKTRAAKRLGITSRTLFRYLETKTKTEKSRSVTAKAGPGAPSAV